MKTVIFKSYMGADKWGRPSFYDCSCFNAQDLIDMLNQSSSLEVVSFRVGHQIWGEHFIMICDEEGGRAAARFGNLGFAQGLAQLGYRIIPNEDEIEIY
jgi:hypothetical protein